MKRTSFNENESDSGCSRFANGTPSRRAHRRRSAPTPRFQRAFDPIEPFDESSNERVMQFTPLRQILDTRTQRRIRRFGLSDEINSIQREKRESANFEKTLDSLRQERDALQHELNTLQKRPEILEDQLPSYESFWMSPQVRVRELERETTRLRDEISVASNQSLEMPEPSIDNDGDTFALNDSTLIISSSPDFRGVHDPQSPIPDSSMTFAQTNADISTQTQTRVVETREDVDMQTLTFDLEAAKNEKRELFNACRMHLSTFEASGFGDALRQSSPPPDFFDNVIQIMTAALSRASDATQALEGISQECSSLGFTGSSTDEVIDDMKAHFRAARIELERAIPGETANVSLEDGKATLGALVQRVKTFAKDLKAERDHYNGSLGREKALRGQFDNLLHRYEAAATKISNLEDSIASSASDMLHTRMRLQDLENEDQEKSIGIDRLNTALDKYHEDVRGLEEMVSRLEDENTATKQRYRQKISELKAQVNSERKQRSAIEISTTENEARIRQLEENVEQNRIRACDLTTEMGILEKEHQAVLERLERAASEQQQRHEEETGLLNVRISELTTSLDGARSEVNRLQQVNNGLEEQLRMEMEARDELLDKWATEQARSFAFMKESVTSERRRAKVRAANWELKSDDLMSDGTTMMGSEPITPVSMTRFVDVEMGRGKNRRRMDSGIGILSEDDLLENEGLADLRRGVHSDIDLPASDLFDV
jgi:DNA repair exonuclease SbcCD ATPase subunit